MKFGGKGALGIAISVACSVSRFSQRRMVEGARDGAAGQLLVAPAARRGDGDDDVPASRAPVADDPRSGGAKPAARRAVACHRDRDDGQQRRPAARRRVRAGLRAVARGAEDHVYDGARVARRGSGLRRHRRAPAPRRRDGRARISPAAPRYSVIRCRSSRPPSPRRRSPCSSCSTRWCSFQIHSFDFLKRRPGGSRRPSSSAAAKCSDASPRD